MSRLPMFPASVVGSMPRPLHVRELIEKPSWDAADERAMDAAIAYAVSMQEYAGLDVVTDGEWRRRSYIGVIAELAHGFTLEVNPADGRPWTVVTDRLTPKEPGFIAAEAKFLKRVATVGTKITLPAPGLLGERLWDAGRSRRAYPRREDFVRDCVEPLRREIELIRQLGIDIVQIDDPALTYYCDRQLMSGETSHDERLQRDWNPERDLPLAVESINRVCEGLRAEVHLHCCHSVYKRRSDVTGDYKPLLPWLAGLKLDRVNLEFAYHGTGDVSDLKALPAHLGAGMGVVDVRNESIPTVDEVEAIAAAGAGIIDPKRIALNPDCGFAPEAVEPPTIDEAYRKLRTLSEAAAKLRERYAS